MPTLSFALVIMVTPVVPGAEMAPAMASTGPMAAGMTVTPERSREIDFTAPYLVNLQELPITRRGSGPIKAVTDLSGKEVYVREGSSYARSLGRINDDFAAKHIPAVQLKELSPLLNTGEIIEMVNAGILPGTAADSHIADLAGRDGGH